MSLLLEFSAEHSVELEPPSGGTLLDGNRFREVGYNKGLPGEVSLVTFGGR